MTTILIIGNSWEKAIDYCQARGLPVPNRGHGAPIYADRIERIYGLLPDEIVNLGANPRLVQEAEARLRRTRNRQTPTPRRGK